MPTPTATPTVLTYGDFATANGLTVQQLPDGGVTITISRSAAGFSLRGAQIGLLEIFARWIRRLPPRPLAVITIASEFVELQRWGDRESPGVVCDPHASRAWRWLGENSDHPRWIIQRWPRERVTALRANRYTSCLYVHIVGVDDFDFLPELPPRVVESIDTILRDAESRLAGTKQERTHTDTPPAVRIREEISNDAAWPAARMTGSSGSITFRET